MIVPMTPEEKSLLMRAVALSEDNNKILQSLRNQMRIAAGMRILYWVVIIAVSYGAFYFIQPYVSFMTDTLGSVSNGTGANILQGLLK